ncbi:hypothetical protein [Mangrovibacterium marinum]|uniref:hypothetical protein n=1 Tax=Mangrovibacterium marinum TaxID=1639118 RepID=UPI002A18E16C|nr:hypothetical protein [Mangrovibacterium marinum]
MIEFTRQSKDKNVLVIGVGHKASRVVDAMFIENENPVIDFLLVASDPQLLNYSILPASNKVCINLVNSNSQDRDENETLDRILASGYHMAFILSDLDGETGAALPAMIAKRCRHSKTLVISVLAYPFYLDGRLLQLKKQSGLAELQNQADAVFMFSENRILQSSVSPESRFLEPIEVVMNMIALDGYININFKDIETLLKSTNKLAAVLSGIGQGEKRIEALVTAMDESPFLSELNTDFIDTILICFESGAETEFLMDEIASVMDYLQIKFGSDAKIIWGNCSNSNLADRVRVTAIVTQSNSTKRHQDSTMKELTNLADQLNEMLNVAELDMAKLWDIARELDQIPDLRIKLVDFEKYNEENLAKLTAEKLAMVKEQNFEACANAREQEKECFKYANFQKYFKLKHSFFYPEERKLFFFHLGTEKNDGVMMQYFDSVK